MNQEKSMKFVQRLFMGIGGLAAVAALLTVVSPKAHALAATLVEVVNTRSSPVPNQDVDHPGRHPYQQNCISSGNQNGYVSCNMPTTPPNTELVIQNVSMVINLTSAPLYSRFLTLGGGTGLETYIPLVAQSSNYMASQPLVQYSDPGSTPLCDSTTNDTSQSLRLTCTITGYTVSLP
jgi:hypothetical protein